MGRQSFREQDRVVDKLSHKEKDEKGYKTGGR